MSTKEYTVRAARCEPSVPDEEVYETLCRITEPLTRSWAKLEQAKKIAIKFNMPSHHDPEYFHGRRRQTVDDSVCRAVLRLLSERTSAEVVATDTNGYLAPGEPNPGHNYLRHLQEFGASYHESNLPPFATYEVPGGGRMFDRYNLSACFQDADAVISVAKMKNHGLMGLTLCMKNLFGLTPIARPEKRGRIRTYFHHAIRLSYVLPDLATILQPCLNVIDGITGQYGVEWGGEGRVGNVLIAGDQTTATDACGAYLMGHDPTSDWPAPPFRRDRNHLLVAAEGGFGTVDLDEIDFESEVDAPVAEFDSYEQEPPEIVARLRQTACEQGLVYRDRKDEMVKRYGEEYIYLQDGEPVWHGPDPAHITSHREFASDRPGEALFLKYVDPKEIEGERFEVYEDNLARLRA